MESENAGDLLFEIGTEELPAGYIAPALSRYEQALARNLRAARLSYGEIRSYGTPRRLVFVVRGLPRLQADHSLEVTGPRVEAAYDGSGRPTKALIGFARAQGVAVDDIRRLKSKKGEVVLATKKIRGEGTATLLPAILEKTMKEEVFPKSMRWGTSDVTFARPVRRLLAIFMGKGLDLVFGDVRSNTFTVGHRFIGDTAPEEVEGPETFFSVLEKKKVLVDQARRKEIIRKGLAHKAAEVGGSVLEDASLTEEVVWLVEYPVVIRGTFEEEFLELPREIIINAMRSHQRYFSVLGAGGELLPYFITVANTPAPSMDKIIHGNERVLRARLNDARFYYDKDRAIPLASFVEGLKSVVFQDRLGTSYEKVLRFTRLALYLGQRAGLIPDGGEGPEDFLRDDKNPALASATDEAARLRLVIGRAAMLSKADLLSGVVGEFPDLQGVMGGIYARLGGEDEAVARAIEEHYRPTSSGGALPETTAGTIVSMADKLDTIAGFFAIGKVPTGGVDPYALRRSAIGIINMLIETGLDIPLDEAVEEALTIQGGKICADIGGVKEVVLDFFGERLRNKLLAEGLSFDSVDAVLATKWYDISDAVDRVRAIEDFKGNPVATDLAVSFKRVSNILKGFEPSGREPESALFTEEAEKGLATAIEALSPKIEALRAEGDYSGLFETLASIKPDIDRFFDDVMVMVDDEKVRTNRLLLLSRARGLFIEVADISRLGV